MYEFCIYVSTRSRVRSGDRNEAPARVSGGIITAAHATRPGSDCWFGEFGSLPHHSDNCQLRLNRLNKVLNFHLCAAMEYLFLCT